MEDKRVEDNDIYFEEDDFKEDVQKNKQEDTPTSTALTANTAELNKASLEIINKIIAEQDIEKAKDLTFLFNLNQNKKTLVRTNKLNDLLDVITDEAVNRFTTRPDEILNKELIDGLKIVQDLIERGQKQVNNSDEPQPFIQINQQNNSLSVGADGQPLSRDSRERVKNAVLDLLGSLPANVKQLEVEDLQEVEITNSEEDIVEDQNDD